MTEDDIAETQAMIEDMVQQIHTLNETAKRLESIVVKYQQFVLDHISGKRG